MESVLHSLRFGRVIPGQGEIAVLPWNPPVRLPFYKKSILLHPDTDRSEIHSAGAHDIGAGQCLKPILGP